VIRGGLGVIASHSAAKRITIKPTRSVFIKFQRTEKRQTGSDSLCVKRGILI